MNVACPWKTYLAEGGKTCKQIIKIMTLYAFLGICRYHKIATKYGDYHHLFLVGK